MNTLGLYVQRNGEVISADSRSLISKRYCTVTSAMNREFWNITSDRQNSIYVGSYGRGTAIDTSDIDILMSLPESYYNQFNSVLGMVNLVFCKQLDRLFLFRIQEVK
ncbi:nucleotidyltransferase domain-containing protein [Caproicibacterium argilliputei]|uniref:Nucleotidyltransferase domain-containing protein n=1 Tax=Caproicibacterium argilliputei TaxID=3030016 RepID=A0AA97H3G0_9FIRM|nr:nucleotidyltransferase domain-containing protein [Caproicibacterium argilliputei]WOC32238.1 nucleotidyltransferase domain-containing protein [Caproicibacterium argilliputei]